MITHEMMKLAVTGTASPRRVTEIAEKMAVRSRLPPAKSTMMFASFRPRPVRVMMPTIMPAAAITGITERAPMAPRASASPDALGRQPGLAVQETEHERETRGVDHGPERRVMPMDMNTTIAMRELKWYPNRSSSLPTGLTSSVHRPGLEPPGVHFDGEDDAEVVEDRGDRGPDRAPAGRRRPAARR